MMNNGDFLIAARSSRFRRFRCFFQLLLLALMPLSAMGAAGSLQVSSETFPLALSSGRTLEVRIKRFTRPGDPVRGLPVLLVFGGFQNAGEVLELLHPEVPVVLATFDYPFDPPRRFVFPGSLRVAPAARRMVHDTIEGIERLAQELAKRPEVDPAKISIVGASLGAPFAAIASPGIAQLRGVIFVQGFGEIPSVIAQQLRNLWKPRYGVIIEPIAWLLGHLAWLYLGVDAPEHAAKRLRPDQTVLQITAEKDDFVPVHATESLWKGIQSSRAARERVQLPGGHLVPGADALIAEMMRITQRWMTRVGLL